VIDHNTTKEHPANPLAASSAAFKSAPPPLPLATPQSTFDGQLAQLGGRETGEASAEGDAGLVSFGTTHTRHARIYSQCAIDGVMLIVDPQVKRFARCKKTLLNSSRLITKAWQARKARYQVTMITLTYAKIDGYLKGHIESYMTNLRNYLTRRNIPCIGLRKMELQQRGAVHYHILLWLPRGLILPKSDKRGWWPHGMTKTERAKNAYGYVAKYISKTEHDQLPRGARLYQTFGLEPDMKVEVQWWNTPSYVRESFKLEENHRPARMKGGGWYSRSTGEIIFSQWQFGGIVQVKDTDGKQRGYVRLFQAERRKKTPIDYTASYDALNEANFEISTAARRLFDTDRIQWLLQREQLQCQK